MSNTGETEQAITESVYFELRRVAAIQGRLNQALQPLITWAAARPRHAGESAPSPQIHYATLLGTVSHLPHSRTLYV